MNVDHYHHHHQSVPRLVKTQKKNHKGNKKKSENNNSLKVVYISSPMKVKTSASQFRSLVQQLTGKNSDISQYMDDNNNNNYASGDYFHEMIDCGDDESLAKGTRCDNHHQKLSSSSISPDDTPTSSESFLGSMDSVFMAEMKEQFEGIFSSDDNSFYDPSQMDVLGSFDELL